MLRIYTQYVAGNVRQYFTEALTRDDYYTQGTERPGLWRGKGAELLGLDGVVERDAFSRLTDNRHPSNDERLTARTKDDRRVGYDISFHAPKSVSVAYAVTRDEKILWAFSKSVWDTMNEMESLMKVRVRRDGANHDRDTGNMLWAEYLHLTTRPVGNEPDPHVHMHNFTMNCTFDAEEQRWKAGQFGDIVRLQPYLQSAFHSRLASNLVEVGYGIRRTEHAFEIEGVPESTLDLFSRRTKHIESLAAELGIDGDQKARLGALTRERKRDDLSLDELHTRWTNRLAPEELEALIHLKDFGRTNQPDDKASFEEVLEALRPSASHNGKHDGKHEGEHENKHNGEHENKHNGKHEDGATHEPEHEESNSHATSGRWGPQLLVSLSANNAVKRAMATAFGREAVVSEFRLREEALKLSYGKATPAQIADSIVKRPELIRRDIGGRTYVTTKEAVKEEQQLVAFAREGRGVKRALGIYPISRSLSRLDERDKEVLRELMASKDRLTLFKHSGPTRKPELTRAALTGIQEAGYTIRVIAPNAAAARQAESDYGLKDVQSVYQFLGDNSVETQVRNKVLRPVLWVENSGRLGTPVIAELAHLARRTGSRIVLSGDDSRARSYERGDTFRLFREEAGLSTVERRVLREKEHILDQAVSCIVENNGLRAVNTLSRLERLVIARDDSDVLQQAVEFFDQEHQRGRTPLLVAPSAWAAEDLTEGIRARLHERGVLTGRDRSVLQLRPVSWSHGEKLTPKSYRRGLVIDFQRPSRGFRSGDRTRVLGIDSFGGVWVRGRALNPVRLRLGHADRFTVSEAQRSHLAVGDRIRLTKRTSPLIGKSIKGNTVVTVKAFNPLGQVVVDGMRVLPRNLGHFEHEYATTVYRVNGRRADSVAFVAGSGGWAGIESKDIAATGEAARKEFKVIVEDTEALANAIDHVRPTPAATDLTERPERLNLEFGDYEHRFERMQTDYGRTHGHGA